MSVFRHQRYLKFVAGSVVASVPALTYLHRNKDYLLLTLGPVRFGRAAIAAASIALDYKTSLYGLEKSSDVYKQAISKVHSRSAERLKELCMRNGGCYTKVGQHLGVLDHLIPFEYVLVMRGLHTQSAHSDINLIYQVFREDFKKEVSELFLSFDPDPLASASLAQVHKACLLDGTPVVVKIQHPHVAHTSRVDMDSMQAIFNVVSKLFDGLKLEWLVEESRKNLPLELDFEHEARNSEKAAELYGGMPFIKIPRVYWETTSSRILTMECCEGGHINDLNFFHKHDISVAQVIQRLSSLYMEMIFRKGFVHCDPHPGNLLISPSNLLISHSNQQPTIVLLDHGLYQNLPDPLRFTYCRLWKAILQGDDAGLQRECEVLGVGDKYQLLACILTGRSWQAVQAGLSREITSGEENLIRNTAPQLLTQITQVLNTIPRQLVFLLKTNDLIRGVCRSLHFQASPATLLHTAKTCLTAIYAGQIDKSTGLVDRLYLRCCLWWHLTRLTLFAYTHQLSHLLKLPS